MGLPPVVVGLAVTLMLWRTGPLGSLRLLYTPTAMVLAQLIVALPIVESTEFETYVAQESAKWREVIRSRGIKMSQ